MKTQYRILICPLEWGLGHAGRCIPLAIALKRRGHEIIFAAGEKHLTFLKGEFPDAGFVLFPGFNPSYSRILPMWMAMSVKSPCLLFHIIREHFGLNRVVREHKIDVVISDNRFGLWNSGVKSVYMTHQLRIKFPKWTLFAEPLIASIHKWFIKKYDYCLVPDLPGDINITGELSHGSRLSREARFIGLLSRFTEISFSVEESVKRHKDYLLLMLSGPEPQKSVFKNRIIDILKDRDVDLVILGADPGGETAYTSSFTYYKHLPDVEIRNLIIGSRAVITRSGYTTVMELISLGKTALLVPTPGQTEQEYLAKTLGEKGWFVTVKQNEIDNTINVDLPDPSWPDSLIAQSRRLLNDALDGIF